MRAEDFDGIDSVWVSVGSDERGANGGFSRVFTWRYSVIIPAGTAPGTHVGMSFRTRDVARFEAQRDTYVVAVP